VGIYLEFFQIKPLNINTSKEKINLMEAIECIYSRRSVRKFLDKPVAWDLVGQILEAGRAAPSAGNLQNWKFIVILDKEKRKSIADVCLQQYWMANAPVHIVVCSEPIKGKRFYGIRGERLYSVQNCAAAAENMLLTAHSLGLGACWIGAFDEDGLKTTLGIIEEVRPQIILTIGYSDEKPLMPTRYKLENMVHLEKYGNKVKDMAVTLGHHYAAVQSGIGKAKEILEKVNRKIQDKIQGK
tara:strand:- start:10947 stop:11669 length:723 start_codon:yes stop_codon:yes gene_type:complete